jgi:hypothetical protein
MCRSGCFHTAEGGVGSDSRHLINVLLWFTPFNVNEGFPLLWNSKFPESHNLPNGYVRPFSEGTVPLVGVHRHAFCGHAGAAMEGAAQQFQ